MEADSLVQVIRSYLRYLNYCNMWRGLGQSFIARELAATSALVRITGVRSGGLIADAEVHIDYSIVIMGKQIVPLW